MYIFLHCHEYLLSLSKKIDNNANILFYHPIQTTRKWYFTRFSYKQSAIHYIYWPKACYPIKAVNTDQYDEVCKRNIIATMTGIKYQYIHWFAVIRPVKFVYKKRVANLPNKKIIWNFMWPMTIPSSLSLSKIYKGTKNILKIWASFMCMCGLSNVPVSCLSGKTWWNLILDTYCVFLEWLKFRLRKIQWISVVGTNETFYSLPSLNLTYEVFTKSVGLHRNVSIACKQKWFGTC